MDLAESLRTMKKNVAPILLIAFVMAIVCTAVFYGLVAGKLGTGAQASATPHVLVAKHAIARGANISVLDTQSVPWNDTLPEGALREPTQAEGQMALADIAAGAPLVASRLINKKSGDGLGIPAGMRAVSVQVHDSSGVVAMLKPGHRVDVQAVYSRSGSNQDTEIRTVLENIEILKINPVAEPAPGRPALPVATLLVAPSEADTIGLADAIARVRLVLRNSLDSEKFPRNAIGASGLMQRGFGPVAMAAAPYRALAAAPAAAVSVPRPVGSGLSLATGSDPAGCNPPTAEGAASPK